MNLSRRGFAGLAAALPFAGNAVGGEMAMKQAAANMGMVGGADMSLGIGAGASKQVAPKMPHWQAMRLALANPDLRRQIISDMYDRHRRVDSVDMDIACLKSLSPMAKVTFQRQRNVERELEQQTVDRALGGFEVLQNFIAKAMWGG